MAQAKDRRLRDYLKRIGSPSPSRSILSPHYEAVTAILKAGHTLTTAHRYLTEELRVDIAYSSLAAYVVRRRESAAAPTIAARATPKQDRRTKLSSSSASPPLDPAANRSSMSGESSAQGSVSNPLVNGTSDWSVLSEITRNSEQEFRQLSQAARRRRRRQRGLL